MCIFQKLKKNIYLSNFTKKYKIKYEHQVKTNPPPQIKILNNQGFTYLQELKDFSFIILIPL